MKEAATMTGKPARPDAQVDRRLPSGQQYAIASGRHEVLLTEVGGALRSYLHDGRNLLDGYGPEDMCTGARGQSLIPWPNRIGSGRYNWEGRPLQLDLSEPDKGGAIHGLTRWRNWTVLHHSEDAISFTYTLHACPGWPWVLDCRLEYRIGEG